MKIRTNHQPRHVIYGYELTEKEREEFDYLTDDALMDCSFVRYKGIVYDLGEFIRVPPGELAQWHGYQSDSFYSGVLVRYSEDYEQVVMATFIS